MEAETKPRKARSPQSPAPAPAAANKAEIDAEAQRRKRLDMAEMHSQLANRQCAHCGTIGAWEIKERVEGSLSVRVVRCMGCRHYDKFSFEVASLAEDTGDDDLQEQS